MEYYFDTDDKLERRKYAEFLKSMLENCDKYRREDSDGAYVIAIDSPWGTGKTRFAKMLRNFLEGREPKVIDGKADQSFIPPANEDRKFNVIYYNSWETDYWNDAIEPLISNIINSDVFIEFRENAQNKELWNQFKDFAIGVLEASVDAVAGFSIWGAILNILIHGLKKARERVIKPFEEYKQKQKLYSDFADSLSKIISRTGRKLVIIVDELDRCRPTFAIQMLELAKHLFVVKGLIFIFALDINQLSHSVQTVYGQGMDAPGYLCRFFDYIGKMPNPNQTTFIKMCLEQHKAFTSSRENWKHKIPDYFAALSISFSLSLRDITTITKAYHLMFDSFLFDYKYPQFHLLYLFLLTIKYKKISLYSDFLNNIEMREESNVHEMVRSYLPKIAPDELTVLSDQISTIKNPNALKRIEFGIYYYEISKREQLSGIAGFTIDAIHPTVDKQGHSLVLISTRIRSEINETTYPGVECQLSKNEVLNDVLAINDLRKWNDIQGITLGQYYYQQLEMFNFALPADEPEPNA